MEDHDDEESNVTKCDVQYVFKFKDHNTSLTLEAT